MSTSTRSFVTALLTLTLSMVAMPGFGDEWPFELLVDLESTGIPLLIPPPITAPPIELPGSNPTQFVRIGLQLYFTADDRTHGAEVWVTDGTAAGTQRVVDLCPGDCSSAPVLLGTLDDDLIFLADDGQAGLEPWATDGTAEGTRQLADICPGECGARPHYHLDWLREYSPDHAAVADGRLFFFAASPESGREIWFTDGTAEGTQLAADICVGPCDSVPFHGTLATVGGRVVFRADDGIDGEMLWATDGETTSLVLDFCPGPAEPRGLKQMARANDRLVLGSRCDQTEATLWVTDGTADGTEILAVLPNDDDGRVPRVWDLIPLQRDLTLVRLQYFASSQPNQLWVTDGTPGGTFPFFDQLPDSFRPMQRFGKRAVMIGGSSAGRALWITDGTPAGTRQVEGFTVDRHVGTAGSWLLAEGYDDLGNRGLYALQDAENLQLVSDLQVGSGVYLENLETGLLPGLLMIPAYADPGQGAELWITPWFRPEIQPTLGEVPGIQSFAEQAGKLP